MRVKCPGGDNSFVKIEIHKCSVCGYEVEIFSDEIMVTCPQCKNKVYREDTPSCIDWCKYARQCLGEQKWHELKNRMGAPQEREDFKNRLLEKMRVYFGDDNKRIQHSEKVTEYAEQILSEEKGDRNIVIPAAILHDIGIKNCEAKYGSTDGQLQEKEGPPVARKILNELGVKKRIIDDICRIIASHHSPGELDTLNFKILWDSDWLVNLSDEYNLEDKNKLAKVIDRIFLTKTGKKLAKIKYL